MRASRRMHQPAHRIVGQHPAVELLAHEIGSLAAQHPAALVQEKPGVRSQCCSVKQFFRVESARKSLIYIVNFLLTEQYWVRSGIHTFSGRKVAKGSGGQVSHLAKIKSNREPGCEGV